MEKLKFVIYYDELELSISQAERVLAGLELEQ